ncbi:MAG: All-trans-phytoene synthase [Candidatus Parcubacteria bacterium]|jgi:phytoene/squalene synthetase
MKDQIIMIRTLYREAEQGYQYLPKDGRRAVELASLLYQGILTNIEKNDYDIFTKSARTNFLQKMRIMLKYFFKA